MYNVEHPRYQLQDISDWNNQTQNMIDGLLASVNALTIMDVAQTIRLFIKFCRRISQDLPGSSPSPVYLRPHLTLLADRPISPTYLSWYHGPLLSPSTRAAALNRYLSYLPIRVFHILLVLIITFYVNDMNVTVNLVLPLTVSLITCYCLFDNPAAAPEPRSICPEFSLGTTCVARLPRHHQSSTGTYCSLSYFSPKWRIRTLNGP